MVKLAWQYNADVKQRLVSNVLYKSTDIIIILSPVFSGGWLFLLWANTLNCSMQMRAITKLLGEEMTAEVGFIGGLTQLSWKPHRITQLSNGYNLMICPEFASAPTFLFHELIHMKRRFFDYRTNCQFVLCKGKEGSFERGKCWNGFNFQNQSLIRMWNMLAHTVRNALSIFLVSTISHMYQKGIIWFEL